MTEPRLLALATAVPPYTLRQSDVRARARHLFAGAGGNIERLLPVFENAEIATRYSCVPIEWYDAPSGWKDRNRIYLDNAVALLMERLGLRRDVQRLPIFGLGCAGGVLGLARAAALARMAADSHVLFLVVELCALCFRKDDFSKSNIVATALFGDGAAGMILSSDGEGPRIGPAGEHTWPQSLDIMGWSVEENGLKALFSRDIPALVRGKLRSAAESFLARN